MGNQWIAQNWEIMKRFGITHIINCCGDKCPCAFADKGIKYLVLQLTDSDAQSILDPVEQACKFVGK